MATYPHEESASVGELHDAALAWTARLQVARGKQTVPANLSADLDSTLETVSDAAALLADEDREPTEQEKALYRTAATMYAAFIDLVNVTAVRTDVADVTGSYDSLVRQLQSELAKENPGLFDGLWRYLDRLTQAVGTGAGIALVVVAVVAVAWLYLRYGRKAAAA